MCDAPIQAFHYKTVVFLADSHEKWTHRTLNSKPIQKLLFIILLIVQRISNKISAALEVKFISKSVLM